MKPDETLHRKACDLLYSEARCLDERRWDDWLSLYREDAEFWAPTWKDDETPIDDPFTELSLIYANSRQQLKERADRVAGGRSIASLPAPRTAHIISNILVGNGGADGAVFVQSIATTHVFNVKKREQSVFFCQQEHQLVPGSGGDLQIARKKLLLLNDYIPRMIDFYTI
ncbi:MAG: aromatic-ring-hydroxylating dioxygenase subunit beta [Hyphomicrobiales bacterium]|nr:aromatic-ring-hydroxylating dioxygenase subunit beta [Hyphomicrobiales bacterium]